MNSVTYFALTFKPVETPVCVCVGGGGGGYSDIFIHTYGLDHLFWAQILGSKFSNSIFLGGFKKMNIFGP